MKKKTFIVQLLDSKKPNRKSFTQVEDANFYSNDTDASLVFIPHEDTFDFETAKVVMFNRSDESLVERDAVVTTEDGRKVASYELPADIIAHWGDWTAQPVFISNSEIYSGSIVPFSVFRYLMHERPPKLSEVVSVTEFIEQSQALVDDMEQEEQVRQSAEVVRVQAEQERVQSYQEIQQIIEDGTLNAEPADGSITTEKLASESITPIETTFVNAGKNLFNKDGAVVGFTIHPTGGHIGANAGYCLSDYIKVTSGEKLTQNQGWIVAFYGDDNVLLPEGLLPSSDTNAPRTFTVPTGATKMRTSVTNVRANTYQIERGEDATSYEPFELVYDYLRGTVPEDGSLTTPKFADNSITPEKTNFINVAYDGVLMDINTPTQAGHLDFTTGKFVPGVMTTTDFVDLKPNTAYRLIYKVTLNDGTEQVQPRAVMIYDKDENFVERLAHPSLLENIIYDTPMKIRVNYYLGADGGVIHDFRLIEKDYVPETDGLILDKSIAVPATSITGLEGIDSYDQSLNTSDDVSFASVSTSGTLPTGTLANPPIGLTNGDVWADTTDSQTHPVLRVML